MAGESQLFLKLVEWELNHRHENIFGDDTGFDLLCLAATFSDGHLSFFSNKNQSPVGLMAREFIEFFASYRFREHGVAQYGRDTLDKCPEWIFEHWMGFYQRTGREKLADEIKARKNEDSLSCLQK